jgi:hypothetical protein
MVPGAVLNYQYLFMIGQKCGVTIMGLQIPLLTFLILRAKHMLNTSYAVLLLVAVPAWVIFGGLVAMLIPAFLTTREPRGHRT